LLADVPITAKPLGLNFRVIGTDFAAAHRPADPHLSCYSNQPVRLIQEMETLPTRIELIGIKTEKTNRVLPSDAGLGRLSSREN